MDHSREAAVVAQSRRHRTWRDHDFGIFWVAQTISVAGDAFAYLAVPLLVLQVTGSVAQMGLLTGAAGVASVLSGVFSGVLVDRVDRRRLMIVCDVGRLALYGLIPVAWLFGPQVWLLFLVLPIAEALGMTFQVASVTAVRGLVDADRITEANGRIYATYAAAGVGGPLLAGLTSAALGATAAIAVNAASFAASAVGIYLVRLRPAGAGPTPSAPGPWAEFLAGARFLWREPVLRSLTVLLSFFIFLTFGMTDVIIYHVRHDLGGSDSMVGLVLGLGALGTIAGALVVAPARRRHGFGVTWIGAHLICAGAVAGLGVAGTIPVLTGVVAAYLCALSVSGICSMSLRQEITPGHLLGRVTSAFWSTHFSLGPIGAALLTWGAGRYGVTAVCLTAGAGCLLIAVSALATPIRRTGRPMAGTEVARNA